MHRLVEVSCALATAVVAAAMAVAAPAAADEDTYVGPLLTTYSYLSRQQLLTEAARVCSVVLAGNPASAAVPMVQKDLLLSVPAALDVIRGAVAYRRC